MSKTKYIWFSAIAAIVVSCFAVCFVYGFNLRSSVISRCDSSLDCYCFSNIVKYRFTKQEVIAFDKFLDNLAIRRDVNILEFTDKETAQNISNLISLCSRTKDIEAEQPEQGN